MIEPIPRRRLVVAVVSGILIRVREPPADLHGVANHHIQGDVVVELHLRVGCCEGHQ